MKLYFYYNKNNFTYDNLLMAQVRKSAIRTFAKRESDMENFSVYPCDRLCIKNQNQDYYCVVDMIGSYDISSKKEQFQAELNKIFYSKNLNGSVRIESNFNPDIFNSKKEGMNMDNNQPENTEFDYKKRAETYVPVEPKYTFDRVILSKDVLDRIMEAVNTLKYESLVFDKWGLKAIEPNPSCALSFYGPSGTGKTMCAEAIANKLGKKILKVSYADIESKYHGEGPKMVKAIFLAAENNDAILFIDEADSLLSKRLTNVTQGSEQAINSMRSQLLICLEDFKGIVIFATNLVVNYDKAFLTRLISVEFKKPDCETRKKIWDVHLFPVNDNGLNIPLDSDVNTIELAGKFEFSGREIRKAVISACVSVAMQNKENVTQADLIIACEKIKSEEEKLAESSNTHKISVETLEKSVEIAKNSNKVSLTDLNK